MTNDHKRSGSEQQKFTLPQSWSLEVCNPGVGQATLPPGSWEEFFASSSFCWLQHSLARSSTPALSALPSRGSLNLCVYRAFVSVSLWLLLFLELFFFFFF